VKITQYVIKVHSRCDLACDHCYVYEHADQSWRTKPATIDLEVLQNTAGQIAKHARRHGIPQVHVVLHGGEPLLLGHDRLAEALTLLRARISPWTSLDLRIHTNGVRLDEEFCRLFAAHGVKIGISLDGDRAANDLHRRFRNGRTSHPDVLRALVLLRRPEHRALYSGLLCTVDLANDPIAVYEALIAEDPPQIDLLLPHATWDDPPPRPGGAQAPYAEWLARIHRRWLDDGRPVPVRLFDSLRSAARGNRSGTESLGLDPVDLLVVETNGDWEQADSLKTAFDGAPITAMNVHDHTVDDVASHPAIRARNGGLNVLCATCRACPVVRICGGGLYAHRYKSGRGFDNPSVFCADLKQLIVKVEVVAPAPQPIARHTLPPGAFEEFAAGPGSVRGIEALADMRLSVTRAMVGAVAAEPNRGDTRLKDAAQAGWEVLCELDAAHPEAVREVFAHPFTQAWAVRCLRPPEGADLAQDRAHLACLAAAAALRAGMPSHLNDLTVPVRDGFVHLPTLGALRAPTGSDRTVRLSPADLTGQRWLELRPFCEDLDPFRDCQAWKVTGRISQPEWEKWSRTVSAATALLREGLPDYAQVLTAGLRAIVPLARDSVRTHQASTARQAFGAIALGLRSDPEELSALMVHEFQHVKLYALMDLYDLVDSAYDERIRVPWHRQLRPAEGVLHGVYAHLAVAELWRARGNEQSERYRSWAEEALGTLTEAGALTDNGARFAAGLRDTLAQW
jgi:uncharacterized protein